MAGRLLLAFLLAVPLSTEGFTEPVEWMRVAGSADGGFLVAWNEGLAIDVRAYDADGAPREDSIHLTDNGRYPSVASDGDRFLIGFHELTGGVVSGPAAMVLDDTGRPVSGPTYPDGTTYGGADLLMERTPRGLLAAWSTAGNIRFAQLSDALDTITGPRITYYTGSLDGAGLWGMANGPSATVLAFYDVRTRRGGFVRIPADAPMTASLLHATPEGDRPLVVRARDTLIGLEGRTVLRATRFR